MPIAPLPASSLRSPRAAMPCAPTFAHALGVDVENVGVAATTTESSVGKARARESAPGPSACYRNR